MRLSTPAILVLVIAVVAVVAAMVGGDDAPVVIFQRDVEAPGTWRGESLPAGRAFGFITSAHELERVRAALPRAVRDVDPAFRFDEAVLFVAYLGEMPTGGYGIRLERVEYAAAGEGDAEGRGAPQGGLSVRVAVWSPEPGAFVTQAFTYPADVVAIPKDAWPPGALDGLEAGRLDIVVRDQTGRNWGPALLGRVE